MKYVLGLTGPTGAGKSTVALLLQQAGFTLIDCDEVCHRVYETNALCRNALRQIFGDDVVDGTQVVRPALARKAFADPSATARLNETVLPYVVTAVLEAMGTAGDKVLLDAPTLYESGLHELCNGVICVTADEATRAWRIRQRDGLSQDAARQRLNAGKPLRYYTDRGARVLENNTDTADLKVNLFQVIQEMTKECLL